MSIKIGHATFDNNGFPTGGVPGDQSGNEVCIRTWYSKPWVKVIRINSPLVANQMVQAMKQACENDNIGFSKDNKLSLLEEAEKHKWNIDLIDTPCDCDDISLIITCAAAAGLKIPVTATYENIDKYFKIVTKVSDYNGSLNSSAGLRPGDILIAQDHIAMVVEDTDVKNDEIYTSYVLKDTVVRLGPGDKYQKAETLKKNSNIKILKDGNWVYCRYNENKKGYINKEDIKTFDIKNVSYKKRVSANEVPIYLTPDSKEKRIGTIKNGKIVHISKEGNDFCYDKNLGWIPAKYLQNV